MPHLVASNAIRGTANVIASQIVTAHEKCIEFHIRVYTAQGALGMQCAMSSKPPPGFLIVHTVKSEGAIAAYNAAQALHPQFRILPGDAIIDVNSVKVSCLQDMRDNYQSRNPMELTVRRKRQLTALDIENWRQDCVIQIVEVLPPGSEPAPEPVESESSNSTVPAVPWTRKQVHDFEGDELKTPCFDETLPGELMFLRDPRRTPKGWARNCVSMCAAAHARAEYFFEITADGSPLYNGGRQWSHPDGPLTLENCRKKAPDETPPAPSSCPPLVPSPSGSDIELQWGPWTDVSFTNQDTVNALAHFAGPAEPSTPGGHTEQGCTVTIDDIHRALAEEVLTPSSSGLTRVSTAPTSREERAPIVGVWHPDTQKFYEARASNPTEVREELQIGLFEQSALQGRAVLRHGVPFIDLTGADSPYTHGFHSEYFEAS